MIPSDQCVPTEDRAVRHFLDLPGCVRSRTVTALITVELSADSTTTDGDDIRNPHDRTTRASDDDNPAPLDEFRIGIFQFEIGMQCRSILTTEEGLLRAERAVGRDSVTQTWYPLPLTAGQQR